MKYLSYTRTSLALSAALLVLLVLVTLPSAPSYADEAPQDATTTETTVVTGDASSVADSENGVNTDITEGVGTSTPLTVGDTNVATTSSDTEATSATGDNTATSTEGTALVQTGDAYAAANSINVINTNIVDSSGLFYFADLFSALGIDLRALNLSYFTDPSAANTGALNVSSTNAADTMATTSAVAMTGANIVRTGGDGTVTTGNAYASANSVNVVNTTIVNSSYLLVGINDFGNMLGDITLPGAAFFNELLARGAAPSNTQITTNNAADVTSSTTASADSGSNTATSTGEGGATVSTGDAAASATSVNMVNTNQVGGSKIFFLFRIWGDWAGTVRGLPAGMSWAQTPQGIVLTNTDDSSPLSALGSNTTVNATDTASLTSSVSAYALTGANEVEGGPATITTGNAYAAANSVNIVNTNLIGTNWIFAIFNIFGTFHGDISFGHPDLWVGVAADAGSPTRPGTPVTFHFTVANRGDADATNVTLDTSFTRDMLRFTDGSAKEGGRDFVLGDIPAGTTKEFVYQATAGTPQGGLSADVPLVASVTSDETDNNAADNTDHLAFVVETPASAAGTPQVFYSYMPDPKLEVSKKASVTATTTPASVDYSVDIYNTGGPAYGAVATDVLRDPSGAIVSSQSWDLDTINTHDDIAITYSALFASTSGLGTYTNTVTVTGKAHAPEGGSSTPFTPVVATSSITILPHATLALAPQVAGATCTALLVGYIAPGAHNDPAAVGRLQQFLMGQGAKLSLTNRYDFATQVAVKHFQATYASDILAPWGMKKPTGVVARTTIQKINSLSCGGAVIAVAKVAHGAIAQAKSAHPHLPAPPAPAIAAAPAEPLPPAPPAAHRTSWLMRLFGAEAQAMSKVLAAFNPSANAATLR